RNDKSKQKWSGGPITGDNTTAEFFCTISTVVESPKQPGVIWVGTDDGLLHLSQDHGKNWKNLTEKLPDFPEWATIKMIEASQHEAGTAYVVIDAHLLGNTKPYLFKTTDFGETWQTLSETMPTENYLHVVREDAKRKDLLFAGYERGVYFSTDAGRTWQKLKLNLPPVPVHDMIVRENDLILGTNGRSIWILDDISPLRAFTPEKAEAGTTLLEPAPAIRWRIGSSAITDHAAASFPNPEYGAILHYYLKKKPEKELKLVITDTSGNKIVAFEGKKDGDASEKKSTDEESPSKPKLPDEPGLHRFVWDLAHDGARAIPGAVADMGSPVVARSVNP
ncbi:MAG TPA: hypothetical protein PKA06_09995, partial [Gemmatales bacterium]|nr:hypothetical protein [Gemmatales bacterium]